jgi:hypothetical protein
MHVLRLLLQAGIEAVHDHERVQHLSGCRQILCPVFAQQACCCSCAATVLLLKAAHQAFHFCGRLEHLCRERET